MNLCGLFPNSVSFSYIQTLVVLCRYNSDIFWSRNTSTIHGMLGYAKELVSRAREAGISVSLPAITALPMGDEVGMEVEI